MPLDPEAAQMLEAMGASTSIDPFSMTPEQWRAAFDAPLGSAGGEEVPVTEVARVENRTIPGPAGEIPVRIYTPATPAGAGPKPGLVYFHGGGWVLCGLDSHDGTCRDLAAGTDCVVVSVDYRLAPEAPFPAAPEDCYAATRWVEAEAKALGIDANRLAVGGDSAGGNLATVVSMLCQERGGPKLVHQLLVYPVTDHNLDTPSYIENGEGYFLSKAMMGWFWHHYLASEKDGANPLASPLRAASLSGLPPATVFTAEFDPLRDEGRAYASKLEADGVPVAYTNYPGVFHGFFGMAHQIPRARQAMEDACAALRSAYA